MMACNNSQDKIKKNTLETKLKDSATDTPIGWRNILRYSRLTSRDKSKQHADQKENYLKTHTSDRTVFL